MAKFTEFSEAERIIFLKDEFIRCIEELLVDPSEIKKLLAEDQFGKAMEFVPSLKAAECNCNSCIAIDKLEARIPAELECLIDISRKRCEERTY